MITDDQKRTIPLSCPDITSREIERVLGVLKTPNITRGPVVKEFEKKIAEYTHLPHAIAVNSGTSALHLVVRGLGLKEGDEVITTPFSFIASSNCLLMEKVTPIFVDVDPLTGNIDPALIEERITPRTKAILVVDVFGHPAEMDRINQIAEKYGLKVIEDSCEAIGAEYNGERVGRKCDAAVFAFFPNKQITTGEGGVIVTANEKLAKLCSSMRNQGRNEDLEWLSHERLGYNYWMDGMSAAMGTAQLERIQEILDKRQKVAEMYEQRLKDVGGITLQHISPNIKMSWFVFVVRVKEEIRDRVMDFLNEKGIACREYFPPIHLQPLYKNEFGYKKGDFPVAEKIGDQSIALPFYNNLKEEDIEYITDKLKEAIRSEEGIKSKISFKRFNDLKEEDINFDFHMHTSQTDGENTPEEMIAQAKELNLGSILFSEHVNETTTWYGEFKQKISELREKDSGIKILIGMEAKSIDFEGTLGVPKEAVENSEIIIGSVHRYPDGNGGLIPLEDLPSMGEEKVAEIEFKLAMGILKNKRVDILGHPFGVYSKYFNKFPEEYVRQLMIESLKNKIAFEINTKYVFDNNKFFELLREINPYVSIGSDAHSKKELARSFDLIREEIKK
jgi:perosamine synthetase